MLSLIIHRRAGDHESLIFEKHGKANKSITGFNSGKNRGILLDNLEMYNQRLDYLHENPVRAGFVRDGSEICASHRIIHG